MDAMACAGKQRTQFSFWLKEKKCNKFYVSAINEMRHECNTDIKTNIKLYLKISLI